MNFTILVVKETRSGEKRVSLIPQHVKQLIQQGHQVFVEHDAGLNSGFSDGDYEKAGAQIRYSDNHSFDSLFDDINLIVRAKRPERAREILENKAIKSNTIMVGALDPLERNAKHVEEYHQAKIKAYSIDQLNLPSDNPMNVLASMSKIAGRLALQDAINRSHSNLKKVVIIGFGTAGRAAYEEAVEHKYPTTVILTNSNPINEIKNKGAQAILLDKKQPLLQQQKLIKSLVIDADIIITTARRANAHAPLLITSDTLQSMKSGAVIVDLALSEGGNVEDSEHDTTRILGNHVIVTNTSGYPKSVPHEASKLWSTASFHFISLLANNKKIPLSPC